MPYPWLPPRGKPEKKAVFSPHCGDETTTYYNRANKNNHILRQGLSQSIFTLKMLFRLREADGLTVVKHNVFELFNAEASAS